MNSRKKNHHTNFWGTDELISCDAITHSRRQNGWNSQQNSQNPCFHESCNYVGFYELFVLCDNNIVKARSSLLHFFMFYVSYKCSKCIASSLFYLYIQVVLIWRLEVLRRVQCVMICEICRWPVKFYCLVKENNTFWSNDKKT